MKNTVITTINNVAITIAYDNQNAMVPIKPICEALGVDYSTQLQKLKNDEDLSSTIGLRPMVGSDNKLREMVCIPLEYVFGWLFTINPMNVKPEAQKAVREYRRDCYHALYEHFFNKTRDREQSLERTVTLQREQLDLRSKPAKTGEDFERFLEIEGQLRQEKARRKSITSDSIITLKTLFE